MKNVPSSLRGDLSKWMQEIATGVYVGNFNTRIREKLWDRVQANLQVGEATISYYCRNEIGYDFQTINSQREVIYSEGLPLVLLKKQNPVDIIDNNQLGFSKQAALRNAKKFSEPYKPQKEYQKDYIVLDIETDGLDINTSCIIEIAALKCIDGQEKHLSSLIKIDRELPKSIIDLTGLTNKEIQEKGIDIKEALENLLIFLDDKIIIGYNVDFDIRFLNKALKDHQLPLITNKRYDLMKYVKKEKLFLKNYKLQTVLHDYDIHENVPHRALEDCRLIFQLSKKVNKFLENLK